MGKLSSLYDSSGHEYVMMESRKAIPHPKGRYFFLGFITALVMALLTGMLYQICSLSNNIVTVSSGWMTHEWPAPPPHQEVAKMARYVVHISEWASISTISTAEPIRGYPFGNILSISDGPVMTSSGTPYTYMSPMDLSAKDIEEDPRVTMSLSEAQSDYCQKQHLDPEDPRCARVLLSGTLEKVKNGTEEMKFARTALFSRHPVMESWPADHNWFIGKLHITHIYVLDFFGGAKEVDVEDYYNVVL